MKINKLLTPYNHKDGTVARIKYIVIHYVGATGTAEGNCKYYASGNIGSSAHYFVDFDGSVWQSVEDKDIAWHCGAKSYVHPECRNANSIGIELCVRNSGSKAPDSADWYFEQATIDSAIELTKALMAKYGVDLSHVLRHYDVTGKICPNPMVLNPQMWEDFKSRLTEAKYKPKSWYQDNKGWWYAKTENTYARSEWLTLDKHRYYFNDEGYAVTGFQNIGGKTYAFATRELSEKYECALMDIKTV